MRSTPERSYIFALFVVLIAHVLFYVWFVPPWQHYDEPTHFEYAALIRELGRVPSLDEQLPTLRRAIAASMVRAGFFNNDKLPLTAPDLNSSALSLGVNERGHPPLYYTLVAIATLPFRAQAVETQLYAARSVGVALAAVLFIAAYWLLRLLAGGHWQLRCAILAALALQPAFADNLASVNSDVLANLVAVLLLLAAVATLRQPGWRTVLFGLCVIVLAWNVKRTLLAYSVVVPIAWLMVAPRFVRRAVFGMLSLMALGAVAWLLVMPWQLADWRAAATVLERRSLIVHTGQGAFVLHPGESLVQSVYPYRLSGLNERRLTFAVWMRSDTPTQAKPTLLVDGVPFSRTVMLDATWRLVTVVAERTNDRSTVEIQLYGAENAVVYADSLALVAGEGPLPDANEPDGSYEPGILGPIAQRNLVRNAGAERRVPPLPMPLQLLAGRMFEGGLEQTLASVFNWRWILAVYPQQLWLLFVGSWGIFGWGQYAVTPGWFTPLAVLVLASILGSIRWLWHLAEQQENNAMTIYRRSSTVGMWWLCAIAVLIGWGVALARVHVQPFPGAMFWSFGRYTFVAMLPGLALFVAGFRAVFPRSLQNQATAAQLAFLAVFALVAASVFLVQ